MFGHMFTKLQLFFSLRRIYRLLMETLVWYLSVLISFLLTTDAQILFEKLNEIMVVGSTASLFYILLNVIFSVYSTKHNVASAEELLKICFSILLTILSLSLIALNTNLLYSITISFLIICGLISIIMNMSLRLLVSNNFRKLIKKEQSGIPALIYGAGIIGKQVVDQMLLQPDHYNPIGFLDDDESKKNLIYMRRRVLGKIEDFTKIVTIHKPKVLIIAITRMDSNQIRNLDSLCRRSGISLKVIPSALEIMEKEFRVDEIEEISMEDILGRHPIVYELDPLKDFLRNKKVLITGAGGSIGSEIARQIKNFNLGSFLLLDRDESSLLKLSLSLNNDGLFAEDNIILCDIRNGEKISRLIKNHKPDIVFHTAALKHLALLEKYPDEAFETNISATKNLIKVCLDNDVQYFVNISTDKAADPISVLGKSKYICERLISSIKEKDKKYISVRFGNVVGSNGSFLHTFQQQIQNGGPVTVTHPEVTRYFMTVTEAVYLVLQSLLVGECGETLILDMGKSVKIADVANRLIIKSGRDIEIKFSNLRPGEKLHEILIGEHEQVYSGGHGNIWHTRVIPLDLDTE
jgi:FlaA1/EpsC-like NDP-sugar epimerase